MQFKTFINETYINVFSPEDKLKYVDSVWSIIQGTYARLGGIKGSGFSSKEDMIASLPMWKLVKRDGVIVAVQLYKDKNGRKFVAAGTNNTPEGKEDLKKMLVDELKHGRSFGEVNPNIYNLIGSIIGQNELLKYTVNASDVSKILGKEVIPSNTGLSYTRNINGHNEEKYMIGTPYQNIK